MILRNIVLRNTPKFQLFKALIKDKMKYAVLKRKIAEYEVSGITDWFESDEADKLLKISEPDFIEYCNNLEYR